MSVCNVFHPIPAPPGLELSKVLLCICSTLFSFITQHKLTIYMDIIVFTEKTFLMRFFIVQKEWSPKNECKYLAELCGTKLNVGALTNISQRLFQT